MTIPTDAPADDLGERLERKARASFEANKSFGRRGKEWALETEIEWQAAARIRSLEAQRDAAEARAKDYRTVAINQGWNWAVCNAYGREAYLARLVEHVDACALNAAEARAREALDSLKEGR